MLLSCPLCLKPHFEGVNSLSSALIDVANSPLTCPVCQEVLKGLDKLTIHLFGHVNEQNRKNSTIQEETAENIDPKIIIIENEKTDEIPAKKNDHPTSLNLDNKNNEDNNTIISCDICSFTFTDKHILEMHQKLLHQTSPDEKTGKYSYHCHLCSKRFRMRGSLMVHLRVAHYGFNNHINLPPDLLLNKNKIAENKEQSLKSPQENNNINKHWNCEVCLKIFTTKYFLKKHKRLHTGEMPYTCTICNKSFTFQQSYHKHMLYHSSEKPYVCDECGRAFKEHSTLQNHVRIHSGERPFGCEICGKKFRQRVSYLVHMRIHTGVMPYKCTACNKNFRYKVSQRSHKCPMNPPGSVVKINNNNNNEEKCIMKVDYNTGNINLIPETLENNDIHSAAEEIYAIIPSSSASPILPQVEFLSLNNNNNNNNNNDSSSSLIIDPIEENIQIIRETCLEELFQ